MTDRECILAALKAIAPGHHLGRIWGRAAGATPDQAQEGNLWAADVEDVVDLIAEALRGNR